MPKHGNILCDSKKQLLKNTEAERCHGIENIYSPDTKWNWFISVFYMNITGNQSDFS